MEDFLIKHVKGRALARLWANALNLFAPKEHTHGKVDIEDFPTALKNPMTLIVKSGNTEAVAYNGAEAKSIDIVAGDNVSITAEAGKLTINAQKMDDCVATGKMTPVKGQAKLWVKFTD